MSLFANDPIFGLLLSLCVYACSEWLYRKSNRFFLFQPLFFGMLLGIALLYLIAILRSQPVLTLYEAFRPGGNWLFWLATPATMAFAIPLYQRNDVLRKHWRTILSALVVSLLISLIVIYTICLAFGFSKPITGALLVQAATTAIALPVAGAIGGSEAIAAFAVILNSVIIYALGHELIEWFRLEENPLGAGLGFGLAGNAVGATKALEVGEVAGAAGVISFVFGGVLVNLFVPLFAQLVSL
ncbi:effector of murein hydrolase [Lactobacillus selangorensis]|uniref:Effector of murein hydrolase n=1 Tax=Lactobacillus selangorensis TaxID=81857 RepID=A0A0R2FGQ2_9LACO|nr:LrgB family protein [Lactobacillus selangorensis]KRN27763.1 effector of murein hydrolase [Lactobacillus selangorensis]KRN30272.1 effector of murein hydrolase [Lactobacillus selangorensis]